MRRFIFIVALLAACKGDKPREQASAPSAAPPPVVADAAKVGVDVCAIGREAIDHAKCQTAQGSEGLVKARKSIDGVMQTLGQSAADPAQLQVMCAQLLLAIERDAAKVSCTLAIEAPRRAEIMQLLDTWYAQRTTVTPTGDAAADAVIAKLAAVRDATCECKDGACLNKVDQLLASVGTMPEAAPQAARTLGSKLLADAARCANRVRTITDPPP